MNNKLRKIQKELMEILKDSPNENECNKIENELIEDIANVINDIDNYYDMFD